MKKDSLKKALSLVLFVAVFIQSFIFLSKGLAENKDSAITGMEKRLSFAYRGEDENSLDVVLLGNSDLYRGFSSLDFFQEHGVTSAESGMPKSELKLMYNTVKDMFKTQQPKIVVLEVDGFYTEPLSLKTEISRRLKLNKGLDGEEDIEFDPEEDIEEQIKEAEEEGTRSTGVRRKIKQLKKAVDEGDSAIISYINYYYPLIKYHGNWKTKTLADLVSGNKDYYRFSSRGMAASNYVLSRKDPNMNYMDKPYDPKVKLSDKSLDYFDKIVKLCKKNNAELVLLGIPSAATWTYQKSDEVQALADKYGIKFYDYNMHYPEGFDWRYHTKDSGNHLNYSGALVVTHEFGNALVKDFNLKPTQLTDEQVARWNADFAHFRELYDNLN